MSDGPSLDLDLDDEVEPAVEPAKARKSGRALFPAKPGTQSLPDPSPAKPARASSPPPPAASDEPADPSMEEFEPPDPAMGELELPESEPPEFEPPVAAPSDRGRRKAKRGRRAEQSAGGRSAGGGKSAGRRSAGDPRSPGSGSASGALSFELDDGGEQAAAASASGRGADQRNDDFDDDDDDDDGLGGGSFGLADDDDLYGGPPSSGAGPASGAVAPVPTAAVVIPTIERSQIDALAQYGDAPGNPVSAVPYAWRVFARRAELRELCKKQQQIHDEQKRRIQTKLAALLDPLRKLDDAQLRDMLQPLAEADKAVKQRLKKLAASSDEFRAQASAVDERSAARQGDRRLLQTKLEKARAGLDQAGQDEARLKAKLKRVDIEMRRLHERARELAGDDAKFAPPEIARQLTPLEQQRKRQMSQLKQQRRRVSAAREALAGRQHALDKMGDQIDTAQSERKQLDRQTELARSMGASGVREAEDVRLDAYETALRSVLTRLPKLVDNALRVQISTLDNEQRDNVGKLELHRRAVDAYDAQSFRNGLLVVGGVLLLLMLLLMNSVRLG